MAGDTIISIFQVRKLMQVRKVTEKEFELWKADSRNTVVLDIWRGLVSEPLQIQNPRMLKTHIKWYSGWLYFFGLQNHCRWWLQPWIKRHLLLGRKVMTNLDSILKSRDITLPTKVCLVKAIVFSVVMYACVWMWELDCVESWAPKNWCFWTVVLEKTL